MGFAYYTGSLYSTAISVSRLSLLTATGTAFIGDSLYYEPHYVGHSLSPIYKKDWEWNEYNWFRYYEVRPSPPRVRGQTPRCGRLNRTRHGVSLAQRRARKRRAFLHSLR